jgi:ATP-dependent helicase/nuclease subunit A
LPERLARFGGAGLAAVRASLDAGELDKVGKSLDDLAAKVATATDVDAARAAFLTTTGTVRKFVRAGGAELKERCQGLIVAAAADVLEVLRRCDLHELGRRNCAHLTLGLRGLDILDELKRRDRVIDFGDLEDMAVRLMGDEARAMSLLFRLEDSISHILVDEYQDTNFNQRDILAPFVAEFLAGGEDGDRPTVFFVGDLKQSIYGFRGAEPAIFADTMALMATRDLPVATLPTNFRSLPAVVDGVGRLFTSAPLAERLPVGEEEHVHQQTARHEADGVLVTLAAYDEAADGRTGDQVAADAAARIVRGLVDGGETTWDGWGDTLAARPLTWSDVLVLYRSRTGVSLYKEAFRAAGIPIEPAGRGMLAASREVQDVLALLRWLVWSDDDLALATVLRSPVFRLPEDLFQRLLAARGLERTGPEGRRLAPATLWSALRAGRGDDPRLEEAAARMEDWRGDTGFVGIHELLRRIYREGHLPERYAAAGGEQARVNLDRLYDLALGPEMTSTPTVRRFIDLVDKAGRRGGHDEGTSGGGDRVRFLTIHGAKGLEAPVVLLIDADRNLAERNTVIRLDPRDGATGVLFGATRRFRDGFGEDGPRDDLVAAGARATAHAEGEEANLLYVALTRARDRLYVLGGKSRAKDDGGPRTYLRQLQMAAGDPVRVEDPDQLERPPMAAVAPAGTADATSPGVRVWTPPRLTERAAVVTPSSAVPEGEDAPAAPIPAGAVDHGLRVHLLLQLAAEHGAVPPGASPAHDEARAVFADERLAWVFRPETVGGQGFSEAPVILRRRGGGTEERVTGVIDRLVVRPERVDVVDFKTNRWGGDPERRQALVRKYAPQMAAYREAAVALYPGRAVHAWLLLTDPAGRGADESGLVEVE